MDGLPRTANATGIESGECLFLPKRVVDDLLDKDPAFTRHIVQLLCEILRRNNDVLGGFAFHGLDARLARVILDLATAHGVTKADNVHLIRKFSQTDLGQMLGVTREAVNKKLRELEKRDMITRRDGRLVIKDADGLKQLLADAIKN